jgi:hypothetical protein
MFYYCVIDPTGRAHRSHDREQFRDLLKQLRAQYPDEYLDISANIASVETIGDVLKPVLNSLQKERHHAVETRQKKLNQRRESKLPTGE